MANSPALRYFGRGGTEKDSVPIRRYTNQSKIMKNLRVAARYAKSLIDLAQEQGKLEETKDDMATLQELTKNRDFYLFIKSPVINPSKKRNVLDKILADVKMGEMTQAFVRILINKGRERNLPEIAGAFMDQYKVIKQITSVKITSATELSEEELGKIRSELITGGNTEAEIEISTVVDPELIGGFILEFDGQIYDASVSHKLDVLRREFNQPNVFKSQIMQ